MSKFKVKNFFKNLFSRKRILLKRKFMKPKLPTTEQRLKIANKLRKKESELYLKKAININELTKIIFKELYIEYQDINWLKEYNQFINETIVFGNNFIKDKLIGAEQIIDHLNLLIKKTNPETIVYFIDNFPDKKAIFYIHSAILKSNNEKIINPFLKHSEMKIFLSKNIPKDIKYHINLVFNFLNAILSNSNVSNDFFENETNINNFLSINEKIFRKTLIGSYLNKTFDLLSTIFSKPNFSNYSHVLDITNQILKNLDESNIFNTLSSLNTFTSNPSFPNNFFDKKANKHNFIFLITTFAEKAGNWNRRDAFNALNPVFSNPNLFKHPNTLDLLLKILKKIDKRDISVVLKAFDNALNNDEEIKDVFSNLNKFIKNNRAFRRY